MAKTRLNLHEELCSVLGSRHCYFAPPSTMEYPCVRYIRETPDVKDADNIAYSQMDRWTITVIDLDPDSAIPDRLMEHFKHYCRKDREYITEGLYHFVYNLYY